MGLVNKLRSSKAKNFFYAALLSSAVLVGCKDKDNNNDNSNSCENGQLYICQDNKYLLKQNTAPIANAGTDISAYVGEKVYLNGCYSEDADGDKLSYVWQQKSGPLVTLENYDKCLANFVAQQEGSLEFKLRVCDAKNACSEDSVLVTIVKQITQNNNRPVALAPSKLPEGFDEDCYNDYRNKAYGVILDEISCPTRDIYIENSIGICKETSYNLHNNLKAEEEPIIWLVGEASDADGDALSYRWEQIEGPTSALIFYPNSISTQVAFPNAVSGNYVFRFRVDDGKDYDYAYTKVYIRNNLRPVANGGGDPGCSAGISCRIPGLNLSYDPDGKGGFRTGIVKCDFNFGDGRGYSESQDNAPDGKFDCETQHTYTSAGSYDLTITVTDNNSNTGQWTLNIDVW
jgi:hypothetical protein